MSTDNNTGITTGKHTDKAADKEKLRNIGPKSSAWLRQVGLRTREDLEAIGAVEAFMRVKRAGFKPTLNLLYSIEGALRDCHWQEVPDERRSELVQAADAAIALLPPPRHRPPAGPVRTTVLAEDTVAARPDENAPPFRSWSRPSSQD